MNQSKGHITQAQRVTQTATSLRTIHKYVMKTLASTYMHLYKPYTHCFFYIAPGRKYSEAAIYARKRLLGRGIWYWSKHLSDEV